ncbi:MAG: MFS transporter [Acidimicrobiia bacterium]|nr:MFS transporter [Acidimicrobiia bacterium]
MKNKISNVFRQIFSSLHNRNFRLFFIGQLISNTGNWITNIALTLLVLHLTHSGLAIGILVACQYGPILLFSVWAGTIADRSNKRTLLIITQFLEMLQSFVLGMIAFIPNPKLSLIYAVSIAGGLFLAFDMPVRRSFVTEMVSVKDRPNAVILNSAMVNASRIFGPALAGILVVTVGYGWAFIIDGISYLVVLAALFMMRESDIMRTPKVEKAKGQIREGLRYILGIPDLWIPFLMLLFVGILSYNFSVLFPLFVEHALKGSDSEFTIVYVAFSVGALLSALYAAYRRTVNVRQIIFGASSLGITMMMLTFVPNIWVALPIVFLVGVSSITYMTATTSIIQVRADSRMHGRILALQAVLLIGTTPIGGPIVGAVADRWGARTPLAVGGIVAILAAIGGQLLLRREKNKAVKHDICESNLDLTIPD